MIAKSSFRLFGPFDTLWSELEGPGHDQRKGKSDRDHDHHHLHHPARRVEGGKQNRGRLNQQPRHDGVRDRDFIDVAPLQLGQERFHNEERKPSISVAGQKRTFPLLSEAEASDVGACAVVAAPDMQS